MLCHAFCGKQLRLPVELCGRILKRKNIAAKSGGEYFPIGHEKAPGLREVYELLTACSSEAFRPPAFESFYLDLSHRLRHGAAVLSSLYQEEKLAAVAIAPAVTEEAALIAGVAVRPGFRRRGLGAQAVERLLQKLPHRSAWVFRAEGENEEFYTSLGFREEETFFQLLL